MTTPVSREKLAPLVTGWQADRRERAAASRPVARMLER
jgi:hypothetical protein